MLGEFDPGSERRLCSESLILAQNERWRHGLGMQVERYSNVQWRKGEERVSNLPSSWEQLLETGINTECDH